MSVWEQRQYNAALAGWQASQGSKRQPSVAAHSIWEALYKTTFGKLRVLNVLMRFLLWTLMDLKNLVI